MPDAAAAPGAAPQPDDEADRDDWLRCHCGTKLARVKGDTLVIIARHHGVIHLTHIPLARILALWHHLRQDEPSP